MNAEVMQSMADAVDRGDNEARLFLADALEENGEHNAATSMREVHAWLTNPPKAYLAYVKEPTYMTGILKCSGFMTTWTGELLGTVWFGHEYRSNMGDRRVPINVQGTNGVIYHGIYYRSAGSYCRIKRSTRTTSRKG